MLTLRRRLASWALMLIFCQTAAVFAAPFSSCCTPSHEAEAEKDCCPAGSHPPGQCPLHRSDTTRAACHMQCDAPHGIQFLLSVTAPLPVPVTSIAAVTPSRVVAPAVFVPAFQAPIPDSPPPRR